MKTYEIGILASVTTILYRVVEVGTQIAGGTVQRGDLPVSLPSFGRVEQTVSAYNLLLGMVDYLFLAVFAIGFGYYVGRRVDMVQEYRRFATAVAVGSIGGAILVGLIGQAIWGSQAFGEPNLSVRTLEIVFLVARLTVTVTVYAFAGAAFVQLRAIRRRAGRPATDDTETMSGS
jgi:hypothetical protein